MLPDLLISDRSLRFGEYPMSHLIATLKAVARGIRANPTAHLIQPCADRNMVQKRWSPVGDEVGWFDFWECYEGVDRAIRGYVPEFLETPRQSVPKGGRPWHMPCCAMAECALYTSTPDISHAVLVLNWFKCLLRTVSLVQGQGRPNQFGYIGTSPACPLKRLLKPWRFL
jgi:hypothetical protein